MKLDSSAFVADPELIHALEKRSTAISCCGDRVLFTQGDEPQGLHILTHGEITLTMTSPNGKEVMKIQVCAGSILGLPGLIGDAPYTLTTVARDGARISFIPRNQFTGMMQSNPMLSLKILEVLAAEVRAARRALSNA